MSAAVSIDTWRSEAAKLSYRNQAFIDGKYVPAASGKTSEERTAALPHKADEPLATREGRS